MDKQQQWASKRAAMAVAFSALTSAAATLASASTTTTTSTSTGTTSTSTGTTAAPSTSTAPPANSYWLNATSASPSPPPIQCHNSSFCAWDYPCGTLRVTYLGWVGTCIFGLIAVGALYRFVVASCGRSTVVAKLFYLLVMLCAACESISQLGLAMCGAPTRAAFPCHLFSEQLLLVSFSIIVGMWSTIICARNRKGIMWAFSLLNAVGVTFTAYVTSICVTHNMSFVEGDECKWGKLSFDACAYNIQAIILVNSQFLLTVAIVGSGFFYCRAKQHRPSSAKMKKRRRGDSSAEESLASADHSKSSNYGGVGGGGGDGGGADGGEHTGGGGAGLVCWRLLCDQGRDGTATRLFTAIVVCAVCFTMRVVMEVTTWAISRSDDAWIADYTWYILAYWLPTAPPCVCMLFVMRLQKQYSTAAALDSTVLDDATTVHGRSDSDSEAGFGQYYNRHGSDSCSSTGTASSGYRQYDHQYQ
jgi:hypothetical protein